MKQGQVFTGRLGKLAGNRLRTVIFQRVSCVLFSVTMASATEGRVSLGDVEVIEAISESRLPAEGIDARAAVTISRAFELSAEGRVAEAETSLKALKRRCRSFMENRQQVGFVNREAFLAYVEEIQPSAALTFVDLTCPALALVRGYLAIDREDTAAALVHLGQASARAPYWAAPLNELGFLLNQLAEHGKALSAYREALTRARAYDGATGDMARALRGIAFSLVELEQFEGAYQAIKEAVRLQPESEVGLREKELIERVLREQGKDPSLMTPAHADSDFLGEGAGGAGGPDEDGAAREPRPCPTLLGRKIRC